MTINNIMVRILLISLLKTIDERSLMIQFHL